MSWPKFFEKKSLHEQYRKNLDDFSLGYTLLKSQIHFKKSKHSKMIVGSCKYSFLTVYEKDNIGKTSSFESKLNHAVQSYTARPYKGNQITLLSITYVQNLGSWRKSYFLSLTLWCVEERRLLELFGWLRQAAKKRTLIRSYWTVGKLTGAYLVWCSSTSKEKAMDANGSCYIITYLWSTPVSHSCPPSRPPLQSAKKLLSAAWASVTCLVTHIMSYYRVQATCCTRVSSWYGTHL